MIKKLYEIFKECFPASLITQEEFEKRLDFNDATIIKEYDDNNNLIGYAVVRENCISLLCVRPEFQRQGHGKRLLSKAEAAIKELGYNEILLGYKSDKTSLYNGVPILNDNHYNYMFFTKRNYDNDFSSYDVSIANSNAWNEIENEDSEDYTVINTMEYSDVKDLFFQLLEQIDRKMYDRYFLEENIEFVFCRKGESLVGMCAFRINEDKDTISIFDLVAYPNFNLKSKRVMLKEIRRIQVKNNINNICVRNVSNPVLYQEQFKGEIKEKYWRGSKAC